MPAPIIYQDTMGGLGTGISSAASSFAQAIEKRGEEKKQQEYGTILSGILSELPQDATSQDYMSAYQKVLGKGVPQQYMQHFIPLIQQKQAQETALIKQKQVQEAALTKEQQKAAVTQEKLAKEHKEAEILSKVQQGTATPEEKAQLSPSSLRTLIHAEKPTFEPTEEKLEAERVSTLATEIEKDYESSQMENMRLGKQEALAKEGKLSTPLMVKTLDSLGLPIGILGNPETEEYNKIEADYVRDVAKVFPGQLRVYEIQAYMKTIPSLMNSDAGKQTIIRDRRLLNEAKQLRYDAYKQILKENGGKKPRNMGLQIQELIGPKMSELASEYKENISQAIQKTQQPIPMIAPDGRKVMIPPNRIEDALNSGAKFQ